MTVVITLLLYLFFIIEICRMQIHADVQPGFYIKMQLHNLINWCIINNYNALI